MLYSISVNNYRSIEKTNLTLRYSRKRAPASHIFADYIPFLEDGKIRAVPVLVIYGANSSGKSTLLSALKTLSYIVKNGHDRKYYTPDRMLSGEEETRFSLNMAEEGKAWCYSLSYDGEAIRREVLMDGDKTVLSGGEAKFSLLGKDSPVRKRIEGMLFFDPFSYSVGDSFSTFVNLSGKSRKECFESVLSLVRKLDLTVDNIIDGEEWKTEHRDGEMNEILFSLDEESEGTRRLFSLISMMLASLSSGSVLVIDEIDVSLHPIVLRALVSLFCDTRYNTTNAQLICSAHNTDLLDAPFLNDDEIAIFEKTRKKGSVIERLSEKERGRNPVSRRAVYLKGGYSGIPFPYV